MEEFDVWQTAEDRIERKVSTELGLIVHTLSEVNENLVQGQFFFRDIREEGIELLSADNQELAQPETLTLQEG